MSESKTLHLQLWDSCIKLPKDYEPYGESERDGGDCSSGCKHYVPLEGKVGADWGVCKNEESHRNGLLTFEHQGCDQFESDDTDED